jgi:hypothetical protein
MLMIPVPHVVLRLARRLAVGFHHASLVCMAVGAPWETAEPPDVSEPPNRGGYL